MASISDSSCCYTSVCVVLVLACFVQSCCGFGTFEFDIHHRFSDRVKGILAVDELPEQGSLQYYVAMTKRDRIIRGRNLATADDQTPVTFYGGNETYQISSLGFLHYANVSVGTPSLSFLVALDTGSDLFWLPCDCTSCLHSLKATDGEIIDFNIYSPNKSSTSSNVLCNSTLCQLQRQCPSADNVCPYQVRYLSNGTSSTGNLVEDVLHLMTNNKQSEVVDARITFGCGKVQTGSFLDGAAPNGLFGLGIEDVSVPSILAREGLAANSFSMCFGPDGLGRISFGDKGSLDQGETPFNLRQSHPTYNISMTQISVGGNAADLDFTAIFDTGTSFTYLNDPAYTLITGSFNSMAREKRHASDSEIPFEFCYDLSPNQTSFSIPIMNLTMKGGDEFYLNDPIILISLEGGYVYCLGVVKSEDINIIGQNFMTGYRVVFDREKMVLGWKASNCYDTEESKSSAPPVKPTTPVAVTPAIAVNPDSNNTNTATPPNSNHSPKLNFFAHALVMILFSLLAIV